MNMNDLIEKALVRFPKAKRIAVENFTMGYDSLSSEAQSNLELDARLYNWNKDTINAIISILSSKEIGRG
jgi:hypothetical protein